MNNIRIVTQSTKKERLTEERWQAIIQNDASWDNKFFYGVTSTGIFCRPSCHSRKPNRDNVVVFFHSEEALGGNFRPCKRCRPDRLRLPDQEWAATIADFIEKHYSEELSLERLAKQCHGSAFHLQRTFKRVMGVSPNHFIWQVRIKKAEALLKETTTTVGAIASAVGIPNTAYFSTIFKKKTGLTPTEYRNMNHSLNLR